jgi:peptidoglycan hydrolase CwlO-like protein
MTWMHPWKHCVPILQKQVSFLEHQGEQLSSAQENIQHHIQQKTKVLSRIKEKIDHLQKTIAAWNDPVGVDFVQQ